MAYRHMALGERGVLAPGRWRWARALGWMLLLMAVAIACAASSGAVARVTGASPPVRSASGAVSLVGLYLLYGLLVVKGERRGVSELRASALIPDLGSGLAVFIVTWLGARRRGFV